MIRFATLAAAAVVALALPAAASAPPAPVQATADPGVSPEAVRAWLVSKGGVVSEVRREDGYNWISIDDNDLNWVVYFYDCRGGACGAVQYSASFSNPTITQTMVNDWNRDHRFLKAHFLPGEAGADQTAVAQYDVVVHSGEVDQLADHTALWLDVIGEFGAAVGYFAPADQPAPR